MAEGLAELAYTLPQRILSMVRRTRFGASGGEPFAHFIPDEAQAGAIRASKLTAITRLTPVTMGSNLINATLIAISFRNTGPWSFVFGWALIMIAWSGTAIYRHLCRRNRPPASSVSEAASERVIFRSLILGCAWAFVPIMLFGAADQHQRVFLSCVIAGTISLAGIVLSPIPKAAIAAVVPMSLTAAIALFAFGDGILFIAGGLTVIYSLVLLRTATWFGRIYSEQLVAKTRLQEMKVLTESDALTRLSNRRAFRDMLESACDGLNEDEGRFVLIFLDLDRFKAINDSLGHLAGDRLLELVARRLESSIGEGDQAARLGGDEFALILRSTVDVDSISKLAAKVISRLEEPFSFDGISASIGSSLGIARAPENGREPEQLLRNADLALYRAKQDGRGTFRYFDAAMDKRAQERRSLELDLRRALRRDEFALYFQPIQSMASGQTSGCEALVRWIHPDMGAILPAEFIGVAEEAGLISDMGIWILETACRHAVTWPDNIYVSVNLSALQFRAQNVPKAVERALEKSGLSPDRLVLEITESVLMDDIQGAQANLLRLRALGVSISLDDFGTGYSSLSYLQTLPFDKIKIDQSFIADMGTSPQSLAIVRAIISLAKTLDVCTTAEGVERDTDIERLAKEGCDEIQGYLIGRPVDAETIGVFLNDRAAA